LIEESLLKKKIMEELFHRGNSLLLDDSYPAAVECYTQALTAAGAATTSTTSAAVTAVNVYANRALAYLKLHKYTHALQDCNAAFALLGQQPKEQASSTSVGKDFEYLYYRKGLAQFELEEYESAKAMFEMGLALVTQRKDSGSVATAGDMCKNDAMIKYQRAIRKCEAEIALCNTATAAPATSAAVTSTSAPSTTAKPSTSAVPSAASSSQPKKPSATQQPATRYEYYQSNEALTVSVLAKNLTPEEVEVTISSHRLRVVLTRNGLTEVVMDKNLFANVDTTRSKYEIRKTKVEIVLVKVEPTIWPTLDGTAKAMEAIPAASASAATATADSSSAAASKPSTRPYASKRDWNAVEGKIPLIILANAHLIMIFWKQVKSLRSLKPRSPKEKKLFRSFSVTFIPKQMRILAGQ
jgi:hypothetical protein